MSLLTIEDIGGGPRVNLVQKYNDGTSLDESLHSQNELRRKKPGRLCLLAVRRSLMTPKNNPITEYNVHLVRDERALGLKGLGVVRWYYSVGVLQELRREHSYISANESTEFMVWEYHFML